MLFQGARNNTDLNTMTSRVIREVSKVSRDIYKQLFLDSSCNLCPDGIIQVNKCTCVKSEVYLCRIFSIQM